MLVAHRVLILGGGLVVVGFLGMGCDPVSPINEKKGTPPRVSDLTVVPDTVRAPASDSTTKTSVRISATVGDADGTVERVTFTLEPSSNPRGGVSGELNTLLGGRYRSTLRLTLPVRKELYSVRVFAVDNDSLTSNQVISQFQVVPDSSG